MLRNKISAYFAFARQCLTLLAGEKGIFGLFLALSFLGALTEGVTISLLVPILEAQGGDSGFSNIPLLGDISGLFAGYSPSARIEVVAAVMALVVILRNFLQYTVDALGTVIPLRLEQKLNLRGYSALMGVEIAYIHQNEYGALVNGISGWAQRVSNMLNNVATIFWNLLIVAVYVAMMLVVSWRLTGLAVVFLLAMSQVLKWLSSGPLHRAGVRLSEATSRVNQVVMESMTGMKVVRLAAAEPFMLRTYSQALQDANASQRRSAKIFALSGPILSTGGGLFVCLLLFGNAVIHEGEPTTWMGAVLLFLFLLFRLMGPVTTLNVSRNRVIGNMHAFDMLNAFYRETDARQAPNGKGMVEHLRESVVFDHVSFTYKEGDGRVIHDLSTRIERGKMVAIVGPSGAGKSTLIALVTRLYNPQKGRILVDGADLRELDVRSWRKRLAVVTQDNFIFNDTVANNIAFGQGHVSRERVEAAARLAAADEFIEGLPQGYDTLLGDRGVRLSGGQQQRIAIARAVLVDPDLLILDEATSHLDTFTERAIQEAVEKMSQDRTVLIIAHRLSTIRKADKVIVMDDGRIVEEGRHEELLARRGIYWEMVEHQRLDLVEEGAEDAAIAARA